MDEPLSNLDALLRENMRGELKALFRRLGATVLYVTHDQGEAMSLSDDVLVLKDGKVRQSGPPLELYARPADVFVATFVGSPRMTIWKGAREGAFFVAPGVRLPLPEGVDDERELLAGFRPEDAAVGADAPAGGGAAAAGSRRRRRARRADGRAHAPHRARRRADAARVCRATAVAGPREGADPRRQGPLVLGGDGKAARVKPALTSAAARATRPSASGPRGNARGRPGSARRPGSRRRTSRRPTPSRPETA